ncbi:hypothetical protein [Fervidibacillus albus]|uniref:Uncharacterized protein n=1 Tax=Fervidibacillus albus TaxID=2980026 RepID=A0A9E8LWR0_9BACI|nr:hypothetical protein [Fervidibacillus albus]WAA10984.1 hypothetical protein OE104_06655 [Fervidibacillus albus]
MTIVTYILTGLYAFLTGLAAIQQWKEEGFHFRSILFVSVSISILVILFIPSKDLQFVLLIFAFILLHLLAIAQGIKTNGHITISHHVIRFIFHCIIVLMVYKFIK